MQFCPNPSSKQEVARQKHKTFFVRKSFHYIGKHAKVGLMCSIGDLLGLGDFYLLLKRIQVLNTSFLISKILDLNNHFEPLRHTGLS